MNPKGGIYYNDWQGKYTDKYFYTVNDRLCARYYKNGLCYEETFPNDSMVEEYIIDPKSRELIDIKLKSEVLNKIRFQWGGSKCL